MTEKYKDKEWLREQIQEENKSFRQIARENNTSDSVIRKYAQLYGIEKPLHSKEILSEMAEEHDGIEDIADEMNAKTWQVSLALEQNNIT